MSREEDALSHISRSIETGEWEIGGRLPAERDLAAIIGASRNTVRNALRVLEARGVVDIRRGSGCYLRSKYGIPEGRGYASACEGKGSPQALEASYILFPPIAALCAVRISPEGLYNLEENMIGLSRAIFSENTQAIREQMSIFLDTLAMGTGNPALACTVRSISADSQPLFELFFSLEEHEREDVFADFVKILHALKRHDPKEARRRMEDRILRLCGLVGKHLGRECSAFLLKEMEEREIFV
jgi:DNA-binding FadR family transcriptional regulator